MKQPDGDDSAAKVLPWDALRPFGDKPAGATEYGFVKGREARGCDLLGLKEEIGGIPKSGERPKPDLVWTPEHNRLVVAEEVPALHDDIRCRLEVEGRRKIKLSLPWVIVFGLLGVLPMVLYQELFFSFALLLCFIYVQVLVDGVLRVRVARNLDDRGFTRRARMIRYDAWVKSRSSRVLPLLMVGVLIVLAVFQWVVDMEDSILAAGLLKSAVHEGEHWRLITATMLHGGLLHLGFNGLFLFVMGTRITGVARWTDLPVVFVFAALMGSAFSLILDPHRISVGASGGLMGLVGYLIVFGLAYRRIVPRGFIRPIVEIVVVMTILGVLGHQMIDNAAHLGGLIGGGVVGVFLLVFSRRKIPMPVGAGHVVVGCFSLAVFGVGAVLTGHQMAFSEARLPHYKDLATSDRFAPYLEALRGGSPERQCDALEAIGEIAMHTDRDIDLDWLLAHVEPALENENDSVRKGAVLARHRIITGLSGGIATRMKAGGESVAHILPASIEVGEEIEIVGPTLAGEDFDLKELRGKVVLVGFWATWSGPCLAEMPNVQRVYSRYHDDGFEVVGVSFDRTKEALARFVEEKQVPWAQIFFDEGGSRGSNNPLGRKYGIRSIPSTYLIDGEGKVSKVNVRGRALELAVAELLGLEPATQEEIHRYDLERYTRAIEADPDDGEAYHRRAHVYEKLKQWEKAISDFTQTLARKPKDRHLLQVRAHAYVQLGDYAKAAVDLEECRKLLEAGSHPAVAYNDLAWHFYLTGPEELRDPEKALALALKAVALDPKRAAWRNTLGVAYYRLGQFEDAVETLHAGESGAFDFFFLAMSYQHLDQPEKAKEAYDKAIGWWEDRKPLAPTLEKEFAVFRAEADAVLGGN